MKRLIGFTLSFAVALLIYLGVDHSQSVRLGLSILGFIALLWMTETFHVAVTALLVPILAVLSGTMEVKQALSHFSHPIIFLFLGGFALAAALQQQGIDQRIAQWVFKLSRGHAKTAVWMLFAASAFTSMWISNTATTAMMLPLSLGMLSAVNYETHKTLYWYVLLGIAYAANIGGVGTLVGSPPNAIAAAHAGISFAEWLKFGMPMVLISLPIIIALLQWRLKPDFEFSFDADKEVAPLKLQQKLTIGVFLLTVTGWLFSAPLSKLLGISSQFDTLVAISAIVLLAALKLIQWPYFQNKANWGILILFGGGLTLSELLRSSGSSQFLGELLIHWLDHAPLWLFILALTLFVVFLTEIASNTASSALLIPIFIGVSASFGIPEQLIAIQIAIAASCAFMLPVATPPNAIVFGSGLLPQSQMMRTGIYLNLILTLVLSALIGLMIQL